MNKQQRKELAAVAARLADAVNDTDDILETVTDQQAEEQGKFENLGEGLQASAAGQDIEAAAEALQEAVDALEEARNNLETALEAVQTAIDGA